jgi:transposase-like protein
MVGTIKYNVYILRIEVKDMPKVSVYREENTRREKLEAVRLYKTGLSMRQVAKLLGRSHSFVQRALEKFSTDNDLTGEAQNDTIES